MSDALKSFEESLTNALGFNKSKHHKSASVSEDSKNSELLTKDSKNNDENDESTKRETVPNKKGFHVRFPNDDELVTGYMQPVVPWKSASECSTNELLTSYLDSCQQYDTTPSETILSQIKLIKDFDIRNESLSLKGMIIDWKVCETLEDIFKRVQFHTLDLESTGLNEQSNTLEFLEAKNSSVPEYSFTNFVRGVQGCSNLHALHLQNSITSGRHLQLLSNGVRGNKSIRDLYLGDNHFNPPDGLQIASLVRDNNCLQLIDLRNNNLQDSGATHIFDALAQSNNSSLNTLVVWNNKLTKSSMSMLSKMLKSTQSLETINLGHNNITNEGVYKLKDGLIKNNSLLRIGLQAIKITCEGAVALAEFIVEHTRLQKLDIRGNKLKTAGLMALCQSLKVNHSVTCIDMDVCAAKPNMHINEV
ncbi:hypothetical protein HELRODRAFT_74301 [Helobdella robusta]|uniref:Uncharacterized protein n=1 Tax=Helobdella robusta TaxID=6412 RepID=T1G1P5_HELRO|nr:hypothetical protein HELRODRAFT_74301 [Helobdella robusta]ESO08782.1 hypothetical protein HELRODRAFT_74301 [Helobdella robusta]